MKRLYRKLCRYWNSYRKHPLRTQARLRELGESAESIRHLLADLSWHLEAREARRRDELWIHGFKVYSQQDEDGILDEVFRRIECESGFFVEFGVQDGLCNNTLYRLAQGWRGVWLERDSSHVRSIRRSFSPLIERQQLRVGEEIVTAENVEGLFHAAGVPREFDLLSIDIDGNDYWVWKALGRYRPRVVVIEYNAGFGPTLSWIQSYDPTRWWSGTRYQGASLKALESLGRDTGYSLVGCNFSGVNAFFVRSDLVADRFPAPHSAERFFRRPRYYWPLYPGHRPDPLEVRGFTMTRMGESETG